MIGLDTNILVRYFTHDDPKQTPLARRLLNSFTAEAPGFISVPVLIELVWVLESSYSFSKEEIVDSLEALLRSRELVIQDSELVWSAWNSFRKHRVDFADSLVERSGGAAGCDYTLTFDHRAASLQGMRLLT